MKFDFHPAKSLANQQKHGIDFEEAQALWLDEDRIQIPARGDTEERYAMLAKKGGRIWAAFFTLRGETIRLISVRRARENEERAYYES